MPRELICIKGLFLAVFSEFAGIGGVGCDRDVTPEACDRVFRVHRTIPVAKTRSLAIAPVTPLASRIGPVKTGPGEDRFVSMFADSYVSIGLRFSINGANEAVRKL
jgi:hypothetical protein